MSMIEGIKEVMFPEKSLKSGEMVNWATTYYSEGSKTHQMVYFDNVSDMVECCTVNNDNKTWDDKGQDIGGEGRWTFGDDFPNVQTTHDALIAGVIPQKIIDSIDKVKVELYSKHPELFDIEASASKIRRKRIFSEDGDELNIDKYMSGDIDMWQQMTRRPVKQSMKIMVNSCLHCGHDSKEFQEGMIMLTAFLDILDKAGITSEVWYAPVSQNTASEINLAGVFCRIKSSEEVLDVCKMLSCGAPGLFRYYTFKVWCNLLKGRPNYGLGRMVEDKRDLHKVKELNGFDVMINANDTPTETFNIITNTLKELF